MCPKCSKKFPSVDAKEFIRIWQTSSSLEEVAGKVHRKKGACRIRAYRYRRLGVALKEHPPVIYELPDWDELARYAAKLVPEAESDTDEAHG